MLAETQAPAWRWWLVAALLAGAFALLSAALLRAGGAYGAALYLSLLAVIPGAAVLAGIGAMPRSPVMAVIVSVGLSVGIAMAAAMIMAYLDLWDPRVLVLAVAAGAALAGSIEAFRLAAPGRVLVAPRGPSDTGEAPDSAEEPEETTPPTMPPTPPRDGVEGRGGRRTRDDSPASAGTKPHVRVVSESAPMVAIVTHDARFERRVLEAAARVPGLTARRHGEDTDRDSASLALHLALTGAAVAVIGPDVRTELAIEAADALNGSASAMTVVLGGPIDPALWESAVVAGIGDVIEPGATPGEIGSLLRRLTADSVDPAPPPGEDPASG